MTYRHGAHKGAGNSNAAPAHGGGSGLDEYNWGGQRDARGYAFAAVSQGLCRAEGRSRIRSALVEGAENGGVVGAGAAGLLGNPSAPDLFVGQDFFWARMSD